MDAFSLVGFFGKPTTTHRNKEPKCASGRESEYFSSSDSESVSCKSQNNIRRRFTSFFPISLPALPDFSTSAHVSSKLLRREKTGECCLYEEIPDWLKNNPFVVGGYKMCTNPRACFHSILEWHNETVNIWTHLLGFFLLLGILFYDIMYRLPLIGASVSEVIACSIITGTYAFTLLLSSVYHTFKCMSEHTYYSLLKSDVIGIGLSLSATILSGTYYAFHANLFWRYFYLGCELTILTTIYYLTLHPHWGLPKYEIKRNMVIAFYVAFAAIPTAHWVMLTEGGLDAPEVKLLLPRVLMVFVYAGVSFLIFARRFPECLYPGKVDYVGASHQIWHLFVILAKLWWHETGMMFLQCHKQSTCDKATFASPPFW